MTEEQQDPDFEQAAEWVRRCLARMLELDPSADATLLAPIVTQMSFSLTWRGRSPESAAEWCFGPIKAPRDPGDT